MKLKRIIISMLFVIFAMLPNYVSAESQAKNEVIYFTDGAFKYEGCLSKNRTECRIIRVYIDASKGSTNTMIFPTKIQEIPVTSIGAEVGGREDYDDDLKNIFGQRIEPWHGIDGFDKSMKDIQTVIVPDTVKVLGDAAFSGMRKLKTIKLSKSIKTIPAYAFYDCKDVKEIALPAAVEKLEYGAFSECDTLTELSVPKGNKKFVVQNNMLLSKNRRKLLWVTPAQQSVQVPNTVRTICMNALVDSKARQLHIGKNVSKMEMSAVDCASVSKVTIDKKNKTYAKKGSCIYKRKNGALAVGIVKKQKFVVNKKVKFIPDDISLCGYGKGLYVIDFAASVKKMKSNWIDLCNTEYNALDSKKKTKIYFRSAKPPKMVITDSAIASLPTNVRLYVPRKAVKSYKKWVKKNKGRNVVKAID